MVCITPWTLLLALAILNGLDHPAGVHASVLRSLHIHEENWEDLKTYCMVTSGAKMRDFELIGGPAKSCLDLKKAGQVFSGIYTIYRCVMKMPVAIPVYCDMETDGGGWTVLQRRIDGSQDFYLKWNDYKVGFGELQHEFWLGNDFLNLLTKEEPQELRIDLEDFEGGTRYAKYSKFSVQSEISQYLMTVSGYQGNAGDSFIYQNGSKFSTNDKDNDVNSKNCAAYYEGAWWFKSCLHSDLNGVYYANSRPKSSHHGLNWVGWKGSNYSLKSTEMKIRPVSSD